MTKQLGEEVRADLTRRGFSRRDFGLFATMLGVAGGAAGLIATPAHAQLQAGRAIKGAVRIGANECWTGPFTSGVQAAAGVIADGNRYDPDDLHEKLIDTIAQVDQLPQSHIKAWAGSGGILVTAVAAFCSPQRGLVTMDPTYESVWRTADYIGAPTAKVVQKIGEGADVRAMLAANPNAGLYYVCSPNNPTGTVTPLADIEWLLANKPADSILLLDEAYIHFTDVASAVHLVTGRKDLIVMRTFSKLFGMAGIRLGMTYADPELHQRLQLYNALGSGLSITAMACGAAVYGETSQIVARRNEMIANRDETIAWLRGKGIEVHGGSHANMFMVDWKQPARGMQAKLIEQKVQIGRSWSIWPNVSRVSVGSADDMRAFRRAVEAVIA